MGDKTTAQRKRERRANRLSATWGSPGFAEYVRMRPCDACGRPATLSRPNEFHHEPPAGRWWMNATTLCTDCHTSGPGARHRVGPATFWERIGKDPAEISRHVVSSFTEVDIP